MKFLVEMPLYPKIVNFLREMGFGAIRVNELGMAKSKDRDIFDSAKKDDMTVFTAYFGFWDYIDFFHIIFQTSKKTY